MRNLFSTRSISPATLFRTGADLTYGRNEAGVTVTHESALTYSGIWACVRLLVGDISTLPLDAYIRDGGVRRPLRPKPDWIETPDPMDPSVTRIDHIGQVALSILLDGNAFVLAEPDVFNPVSLTVLNPVRVRVTKPRREPEYHVTDMHGRPTGDAMGPSNIIHIPYFRAAGSLRGMSPIDMNAGSIAISLAARKYVERFFGSGAMVPGFISLPVEATQPQADDVAKKIAEKHGGWRKAGTWGVLSGGAKVEKVGLSPQDADLTTIFRNQLEEGARIYGIPPFMVGSQEAAGVAYASSVERAQHYIDHALRHYIEPIEVAYRRLVPGPTTYVKFNYDAFLRGDTKSRYESYQTGLASKFLYLEDVWRLEDMDPGRKGTALETPNNNGPKPTAA